MIKIFASIPIFVTNKTTEAFSEFVAIAIPKNGFLWYDLEKINPKIYNIKKDLSGGLFYM